MVEPGSGGQSVEPERPEPRVIDRLHPRVVLALTVIGFAVPIGVYFWAVAHYGVNVFVADQLHDVTTIQASQGHLVPWQALWAQWTENRMLFPNIIVLVLAHTTQFNIHSELFLSAVMVLGSLVLLVWAHKRRVPDTPWLYYCPVALLTFSLVQYENTFIGFQMAWFLVLLCLAASIALVDRTKLGWPTLVGAIAVTVVGSLSSVQGLFIWLVGLFLLYHRRRQWPQIVVWLGAGAVTVAIFFYRFDTSNGLPSRGYAVGHLWSSVKAFLFSIGDVLGVTVPLLNHTLARPTTPVIVFGAITVVLAVIVIALYGIRRDDSGAGPIGVALVGFGLLFAASTTEGRASLGYAGAAASRYTTYDLLILTGIYLALLVRPLAWGKHPSSAALVGGATASASSMHGHEPEPEHPSERPASPTGSGRWVVPMARWLIGVLLVVQVVVGFSNGLNGVHKTYHSRLEALVVTANRNDVSPARLRNLIGAVVMTRPFILQQLDIAQRLKLGQFAGSSGSVPPQDHGARAPST